MGSFNMLLLELVLAVGNKVPMNDKKYKVLGYGKTKDGRHIRKYEHRVVAEAMIGRPILPSEVVHHKNGNGFDNRPCNLQVIDRGDHVRGHISGSKAPWYRKDITVKKINKMLKMGMSCRAIGRHFDVPHITISRRINKGDA
jgi:hypothetical protein